MGRQAPARSRALALALALALSLASSACSSPRTEIIVAVDSDLAVPAELDQITIQVTAPDGTNRQSVAALGGTNPALPRTLGLVYEGGPLGPFVVRASGAVGGVAVVTRAARVSFVLERTLLLRLDLLRDCIGSRCGGENTCVGGACRSVDVPASELTEWTGSVPPLSHPDGGAPIDGGTPPDAGPPPPDSGPLPPDAGPPPADAGGCDPGRGDCDGRASNGCETDLSMSRADCGMCGHMCTGTQMCCTGTCMPSGSC